MLEVPASFTVAAHQTGNGTTLNPAPTAGNEGVQLVDLPGSNFLELYLARFFQIPGQAQPGALQLPPAGGEYLPDGKDLPLPIAGRSPISGSSEAPEEPAVNPLLVLLFRQIDTTRSVEPGADTAPVLRNYPAEKIELPGTRKLPTTDILKQASLRVNDQTDTQKTQGDTVKSQLLFDRVGIRDLAQIPENNFVIQERPAVTGIIPQENTMVKQSTYHSAPMPKTVIDTPVDHKQWGQSLAARVSMMIANHQHTAQISVNPPELGPIEVKITVNHDQANVNFFAHHGDVREAITDAFPRLRDMLAQNGMSLGESNVFEHSFAHDQNNNAMLDNDISGYAGETDLNPVEQDNVVTRVMSMSLVDHYV